jgi:translation initiation factor 2B subunit (eIF-2B alpha/beta/delta family)
MTTAEALFKKERLQAIVDDRQSGAAQLGRVALQTLADYSQVCEQDDAESYTRALLEYAQALQQARPSMAPLVNLIGAWSNWLRAEPDRRIEHLQ